jgi:hypothetical protein
MLTLTGPFGVSLNTTSPLTTVTLGCRSNMPTVATFRPASPPFAIQSSELNALIFPCLRKGCDGKGCGSETADGSRRAFSGSHLAQRRTAEALAVALPAALVLGGCPLVPASRRRIGSRLEGTTTVMSGMYLAETSLTLKRIVCFGLRPKRMHSTCQ